LNIDFGINNKRQNCKIGTVWGGTYGTVNGGDKGEGIWLMDFTNIYEIEQ
jgi:hypothetical protein